MAQRVYYQPMNFTARETTPSLKRTDKQSGWKLIAIDEDKYGKSKCLICREFIVIGSVRIRAMKRDEKKAHLQCWKMDPILDPTFFPGYEALSDATKQIVQKYCDDINAPVLKKRKADEELPETRAIKRICLETLQDEKQWEAEGTKCPIKSIPIEILQIVLDDLDLKSLQNFARSCKRIYVTATDEDLWKKRVESIWPRFLHLKTDETQRWWKFYQIMLFNTCYHCREPTPLTFAPVKGKLCVKCRQLSQYELSQCSGYWIMERLGLDYKDLHQAGIVGVKSNTGEKYVLSQLEALAKKLNRVPKQPVNNNNVAPQAQVNQNNNDNYYNGNYYEIIND